MAVMPAGIGRKDPYCPPQHVEVQLSCIGGRGLCRRAVRSDRPDEVRHIDSAGEQPDAFGGQPAQQHCTGLVHSRDNAQEHVDRLSICLGLTAAGFDYRDALARELSIDSDDCA